MESNKELEALNKLKHSFIYIGGREVGKTKFVKEQQEAYNIVKSALERKEKLNKVWEIVKEKNPRLSLIKSMIKTNSVDFDNYNCAVFSYERLTETEFNDLVEMLEEVNENTQRSKM